MKIIKETNITKKRPNVYFSVSKSAESSTDVDRRVFNGRSVRRACVSKR